MSEQPSAERIVCACFEDARQDFFFEWKGAFGWSLIWKKQAETYLMQKPPHHQCCFGCGSQLWWPGEDPAHPAPHAGPSNAELQHALQDLGGAFREACARKIAAEREVAVRERALGDMSLYSMNAAGTGWLNPQEFIAEARRQLEEEQP